MYRTPLVNGILRGIEERTTSDSKVHRLAHGMAQAVRLLPRFLHRSIHLDHLKELKHKTEGFFKQYPDASIDQIYKFFDKHLFHSPINACINKRSQQGESQILRNQIRMVNNAYSLLKSLQVNDSTKINFINALYSFCFTKLKMNLPEDINEAHNASLDFIKKTGFIMNPSLSYDIENNLLENKSNLNKLLNYRFFIPARVQFVTLDDKAHKQIKSILGTYIQIPGKINCKIIEYTSPGEESGLYHSAVDHIFINNYRRSCYQVVSKPGYQKYMEKNEAQLNDVVSTIGHELIHSYLIKEIDQMDAFANFVPRNIAIQRRGRVVSCQLESLENKCDIDYFVGHEMIAYTFNVIRRRDDQMIFHLMPEEINKELDLIQILTRKSLEVACEILEVDSKTLLETIRQNFYNAQYHKTLESILDVLGDQGYQLFIDISQEVFLKVSHQLLDHLKTKGLLKDSLA